jgi:ribosome maturation factor RimP
LGQGKYALAHEIVTLLEDELSAAGFDLLDVRLFRGGGRLQVRIYVDTADGIDLDGCARASRTVNILLEEANLIRERYVIEVSSPGIRRPLRKPDHFRSHQGQMVDLKLRPERGERKLRGKLTSVTSAAIEVLPQSLPGQPDPEPSPVTLPFTEILEANLDPEFDAQQLIQADRRRRKEERRANRQRQKDTKTKRRPKR